jgi:hypothetical protein
MRRGPKQKYRERERLILSIEKVELEILELGNVPYQKILQNTLKEIVRGQVEKGHITEKKLKELSEVEEIAAQRCELNCEEHRSRAREYQLITSLIQKKHARPVALERPLVDSKEASG